MKGSVEFRAAEAMPWSVDGLIAAAERIMTTAPDLFARADGEGSKELNVRLIRDYVVRELIPRPGRMGREASFGFEHLAYLLAVRALLRNRKWSLPAIKASFLATSAQELLDGVLARVRSRIEAEYRKASRSQEGKARVEERRTTPSLNPAQLLIQQFKGAQPEKSPLQLQARFHDSPTRVSPLSQPSTRQDSEGIRRRVHLELNSWCEAVLDADHISSLTTEEIELLGEMLKKRLRSEKQG